jgi:hypothetical protein
MKPDYDNLPDSLPIFPLTGVLLLPGGQLPLNIFEPRYLAMVDSALKSDRMIGMIQPQEPYQDHLFSIGCAGRIISFEETPDGRYLITLEGVARFKVVKELDLHSGGFRQVKPGWGGFEQDLTPHNTLNIDRMRLTDLLKNYFEKEGMSCAWEKIHDTQDDKLMTCLSMVCPFDPKDKQALLEAPCCKTRADIFMTLLEIAVKGGRLAGIKH